MTRWELQPLQYLEDEDGDGPQNVGFFAIQPFDAAGSPRRFYYRVLILIGSYTSDITGY
jgi:hypothetical protein